MSQYGSFDLPEKNIILDANSAGRLINDNIINNIFIDSMLCRENVKISPAGHEVVPTSILDYKASIPNFYLGSSQAQTSASYIYDSLINLTHWLLKVGTYNYNEYRSCSGLSYSRDKEWSSSGRALFTDEYASTNVGTLKLAPMPEDGGVFTTNPITVETLKAIANNCISSWMASKRPIYTNTYNFCHNSCHNNCHNDCHTDCHSNSSSCHSNGGHSNCHGFQCHGNGPGYNNAGHGGYKSD